MPEHRSQARASSSQYPQTIQRNATGYSDPAGVMYVHKNIVVYLSHSINFVGICTTPKERACSLVMIMLNGKMDDTVPSCRLRIHADFMCTQFQNEFWVIQTDGSFETLRFVRFIERESLFK